MIYMSPAEITAKFKRNTDKTHQIQVLAELNGCSKKEIIKTLLDSGVKWEEIPRMRGINKSMFTEDKKEILEDIPQVTCFDKNVETTDLRDKAMISIPDKVIALCKDRVKTLSNNQENLQKQLEDTESELEEIMYFLRKAGATV